MTQHPCAFKVDNIWYELPYSVMYQIERYSGKGNKVILDWITSHAIKFRFGRSHKVIMIEPVTWDGSWKWSSEHVITHTTLQDAIQASKSISS